MFWVKNNPSEKGVGGEERLFLTQHAAAFGSGVGLQSVCIAAAGEMWLHPPALIQEHTSDLILLPLYHGPAPLSQLCSLFHPWLVCPGKSNSAWHSSTLQGEW